MFIRYLTWILAGLFVLFGVAALTTDSETWRRFWIGLSTLSLGGFGISMAKDALTAGQIRVQNSIIRYAHQPRLFWAAVILVAAAGVGVSISGIWFLFFKD